MRHPKYITSNLSSSLHVFFPILGSRFQPSNLTSNLFTIFASSFGSKNVVSHKHECGDEYFNYIYQIIQSKFMKVS